MVLNKLLARQSSATAPYDWILAITFMIYFLIRIRQRCKRCDERLRHFSCCSHDDHAPSRLLIYAYRVLRRSRHKLLLKFKVFTS